MFDPRNGFTASNQMHYLGFAFDSLGHDFTLNEILGRRVKGDLNIFFPFHYWKNGSYARINDGVGGWHTPKLKPFQKNDIPIGFADSSIFDAKSLEDIKQYPYAYFGAMSKDTAKIMNLPRTEIIKGCYNPVAALYGKKNDNDVPVIYVNATNFPYRRGVDIAFRVLHKMALEGIEFTVILRSWQDYILPDSLTDRTYKVSQKLNVDEHYKIMDSADIMFSPVRGGGFELQILEALVMGKTVVMPNKGGWTDIPLNKDDVYWIKAGRRDFPIQGTDYTQRAYHSGGMFQINENDAYEQLKRALKYLKKPDVSAYLKEYSPVSYAERILKYYEEYR